MQMNRLALSLVIGSALAASNASAAVTFSDNFDTNTLGNYSISQQPVATHSTTAGIGGGGGVAFVTDPGTGALSSVVNTAGFTLAPGESLDMSVLVQKSTQGYNGSSQLFLGVTDQSNDSWGGGTVSGKSAIGLVVNQYGQIGTRSSTGGVNNIGNFTTSAPFGLTNGNWYRLMTTITKPASGNNWTVSGQFQDWGASGTSLVSTILTLPTTTVTMTSASLNAGGVTTLGQFGIRQPAWSAADNFTFASVPEPSALAIGGVVATALAYRRRR